MPRSDNDQPPATYVLDGQWPDARLREGAPLSAHYAQRLARNLAAAIDRSGLSVRALGLQAGISHSCISRMLHGRTLPDIGTLARIEAALDTRVWPGPMAELGSSDN